MSNDTQLNNQIIDLLFEHDCVIIPGFGGFVAQYSSAIFEAKTKTFSPPSKSILFNKNLINNDGLLAHKYVSSYQLTYEQAIASIEKEVDLIKRNLLQLKRHELIGLGVFFMEGSTIKFEKSSNNFLSASFGLPAFSIDEFEIPESNTKVDSKEIIPLDPKKPKMSKWWVAAAIVPFLFYSAWIPLKTNLFNADAAFHYSELNPFSFTNQRNYSFNDLTKDPINKELKIQVTKEESKTVEPPKVVVSPKEIVKTVEEEVIVKPKEVEDDSELLEENSHTLSFHVIGGCFKKQRNAKKLIKKLKKLGFDSYELDVKNDLHRIVISSFSTKKEARQAQKEIKSTHGISSWVLKK